VLKNTIIKLSKYVVNQKLEHVGDISFRELSGRINPMTSYLYLGWPFVFGCNTVGLILLIFSFGGEYLCRGWRSQICNAIT
jgi:hypothetical protein